VARVLILVFKTLANAMMYRPIELKDGLFQLSTFVGAGRHSQHLKDGLLQLSTFVGAGHGHVSNFYIVDLENFSTASRLYTGDIHNSTVVGLFMTPVRQ